MHGQLRHPRNHTFKTMAIVLIRQLISTNYFTKSVLHKMLLFWFKFNQTIYYKSVLSTRLNNILLRFGQVYDESIEYRTQFGYR